MLKYSEAIERHLKTHTERSADDSDAVSTLESFLKSGGRINTTFAKNDKGPNIDGRFELVPDPENSRRPVQSFVVQIKGTNTDCSEKDGIIKYHLKSLAFPAYVYQEVTLDPGILFVVFKPSKKGEERIFWKYMSAEFINSIDFNHDSVTISFNADEEIFYTDESINKLCGALKGIAEHHSFVNKLENRGYLEEEINAIVSACNEEITEYLDRFDIFNETRDNISRRILTKLTDLCVAAMLLNSRRLGNDEPSVSLAWEQSLLNIKTKYLASFYRMLKYPGSRSPAVGQAERLMLKYYNFLWQIRKDLKEKFGFSILKNLEKFPLKKVDEVDKEYYKSVANSISALTSRPNPLRKSRYYVQKKAPFFVNGERYYEITLQLAGVYASKYNRITAYTKENISTNYSIQIGYEETVINLWDVDTKIKVITDWKVSIEPACLNKLAKILKLKININSSYKEYHALMEFLTETGISLLDFIDLREVEFSKLLNAIYDTANTEVYKAVLLLLRNKYSKSSTVFGRHVIRYLLVRLKEETLECVMPTKFDRNFLCDDLHVTSRCYPFEKKPYISNLAGSKTSELTFSRDVASAVGYDQLHEMRPYLRIQNLIKDTRDICFEEHTLSDCSEEAISEFNNQLDGWERGQGYLIKRENGLLYIDSYLRDTVYILQRLLDHSKTGNKGQKELNNAYLRRVNSIYDGDLKNFGDEIKITTLQNVFVDSKLLLIYGAAGTGKTTLINYISNLMSGRKKLFLTKTHAAKKNLERRIDNPGSQSEFVSIDSFSRKITPSDYDVVFVDECSTIDNRTMLAFLNKLDTNTLLVLAGDIYQIESIDFGNWFYYAKDVITARGANVELLSTWRTKDKALISLWDEVRNKRLLITEKLAYDGPYSEDIGPNILERAEDDEVVLCLNYDGKFGLNNINAYFQNANPSGKAVVWQEWNYKVGDRVLFNDTKRFSVLYNNLKGKIVDISKAKTQISFTMDVETILTEADCRREELVFLGVVGPYTTRVRFTVYEDDGGTTDEERELSRKRSVVPFHLAYAVSIHKSQGLEYDSVKIIIPSSNSEKITHGIFYTAITRAKKKLKIYWSPETMREIIESFEVEEKNNKSLEMVKQKLN